MCGIAGYFSSNQYDLNKWLNEIKHRGPDSTGTVNLSHGEIGMVRLSIIGLDTGFQPMTSHDGNYSIVFNGEIFNFKKLQDTLNFKYGTNLSSTSDTEILFHGLMAEGMAFLERVDGMFSFCFVDAEKQKAFLAIDKFGIKKLYYQLLEGGLSFSSESTKNFADFEVSPSGLDQFLSFGFTADQSINKNVNKLKNGEVLEYQFMTQEVQLCSYISENEMPKKMFYPDFEKPAFEPIKLRQYVVDAVEAWSVSDVPISLSLSSGTDSSVLAICLAELGRQKDVECITIDVEGDGISETDLSQEFVDYFGLNRKSFSLFLAGFGATIPQIMLGLDEPYFGSFISWWIYLHSTEKVVLTGSAGDELFGNYNKALYAKNGLRKFKNSLRSQSSTVSRFKFQDLAHCYTPFYGMNGVMSLDTTGDSVVNKSFLASGLTWENFIPTFDITFQLQYEFLYMTDRFSMQNSIEARVPFLSKVLHEYISSCNYSSLVRSSEYKGALLDAFPEIRRLRTSSIKLGFVDGANWMSNYLKKFISDNPDSMCNLERIGLNSNWISTALEKNRIPRKNKDLLLAYIVWSRIRGYI